MISTNQFRNGSAIRVDGKRFTILFFQHVKPGKGGAFVRTRLRNIDSGAVVEKTFRAGEKLENVRTESRPMTYLYRDGDMLYFMDSDTYDQVAVQADAVGEAVGYVVEGGTVSVLSADGEVVSVEPPAHVDLAVAETDPGLKGDTATGGTKPATLETGVVVQVPLFVNVGDRVRVDTRSNEFLTRVCALWTGEAFEPAHGAQAGVFEPVPERRQREPARTDDGALARAQGGFA